MKKSSQRVFDLINRDNNLTKNPISADIVRLGNPKVNTNKDIPRNTEILLTALPGQRVKGSDVKWYNRVDIGKIFATPPTVRIVKNGINTSTDVAWALDAAYPDLELDPNDFAPYPINELPTTAILRALPNSLAWLGECTINVRAAMYELPEAPIPGFWVRKDGAWVLGMSAAEFISKLDFVARIPEAPIPGFWVRKDAAWVKGMSVTEFVAKLDLLPVLEDAPATDTWLRVEGGWVPSYSYSEFVDKLEKV